MNTVKIHYAHCVKFAPGQLDQPPYSQYEARTVEGRVSYVVIMDIPEWQVRVEDKSNQPVGERFIADGETEADALAVAAYELMKESRNEAYNVALKAISTK